MMIDISKIVFEKFNDEISKNLAKKHFPNSPQSILSGSFNLGEVGSELFGVIPEILCGYLAGGKVRERIIVKAPANTYTLKNRKGILLCHALSPYLESIGFYCDLGRAFRMSLCMSLQIKIMLAGTQWTNYNYVVKDLGLKLNLPKNEEWRRNTYYKLLHVQPDEFTIDNVKDLYKADIHLQANDYIDLVIKMYGDRYLNRKFSDDEVEKLLRTENVLYDLAKMNIVKDELNPILKTIQCVLKNFKRLDEETFVYFLTQYYHQSKYNGYLKISMEREKDFDDSFKEIYHVKEETSIKHNDLIGIYLEDYKYGFMEEKYLTVHPYYFPSGSLYTIFEEDIQSEVNNCIMINDSNNLNKIIEILDRINYLQRARIMADLLSFAHILSYRQENVKGIIYRWFKENKLEHYGNSWEIFTNKSNSSQIPKYVNNWSNLVFTSWCKHENYPWPYWFIPFFWNDIISVDKQAKLITLILSEAERFLGLPVLASDPLKGQKYTLI